jgi:two-component system chemotaxis sensor kinase CheA
MLVFRGAGDTPKAVPLSLVARLEEIDLATVERSNGQYVVQYRGQLMPLVQMGETGDLAKEGRQPVLVFADGGRSMGLVVREIVDIVEGRLDVELTSHRTGYLGSAIVGGQATDIIDAGYYLIKAFQDWFGGDRKDAGGHSVGRRILLVDDSPFFRNLLAPLLTVAGYEVTTVEGADQALELREAGIDYDVIISDIEMPDMDGFDFAQEVKTNSRWSQTPLLALSSHTTPQDLARGRSAGFDDYVAKADRDALLVALQETLSQVRGAA